MTRDMSENHVSRHGSCSMQPLPFSSTGYAYQNSDLIGLEKDEYSMQT